MLRAAILEQALAPGAKLPEDMIGERLGVSRTVVREALGRLAAEGLVELRPRRGAIVARPGLEEAREVFAVRRGLERMVMEALAARITPAQLAALEAHVAAEETAQGQAAPVAIRLAGEFHRMLAEMAGNALLARYVRELASRCSLILAVHARPHCAACAVSEHRALIAALRAGDAAAGAALMERHLGGVAERALPPPPPSRDMGAVLDAYAAGSGLAPPARRRRS